MSQTGKSNYKVGDVVSIMRTPEAQKQNADTYLGIVSDAKNQNALKIDIYCRRVLRTATLSWSSINLCSRIEYITNHANTRHLCCVEAEDKNEKLAKERDSLQQSITSACERVGCVNASEMADKITQLDNMYESQIEEFNRVFCNYERAVSKNTELKKERDQLKVQQETASRNAEHYANLSLKLEEERDQLRAELEKFKWQPIESAPRDGTDILVRCADTGECFVAYNDETTDAIWIYAYYDKAREGRNAERIRFKCEPNEWMPLPGKTDHIADVSKKVEE